MISFTINTSHNDKSTILIPMLLQICLCVCVHTHINYSKRYLKLHLFLLLITWKSSEPHFLLIDPYHSNNHVV